MAARGSPSPVWEHYTRFVETHHRDGMMEEQIWAKCNRCAFKTRAEPIRGTMNLWKHLKSKHQDDVNQHQLQAPHLGEGNNGDDMGGNGIVIN